MDFVRGFEVRDEHTSMPERGLILIFLVGCANEPFARDLIQRGSSKASPVNFF